jgi:sec-independent protein translocase protein TatA
MLGLGPTELIIILVIIILFFGVGRISKLSGEAGSAIRKFKQGLQGEDKGKDESPDEIESSDSSQT